MSNTTRSILVERGPVSLGCGTLILIALIVMFFSNSNRHCDTTQLERDVQRLQSQIGILQSSIENQTRQISRLEDELRERRNTNAQRPQAEANTPEGLK